MVSPVVDAVRMWSGSGSEVGFVWRDRRGDFLSGREEERKRGRKGLSVFVVMVLPIMVNGGWWVEVGWRARWVRSWVAFGG